ncbi:putative L-type lectin-domain containing receptor kinase S.7 [Bienertia sinuspersici]
MDAFKNEWDQDGNHISIDTQSVMKSLAEKSLNSSKIDLKSGRSLSSFLNYTIKISEIIPRQIYMGFTAATGTLTETCQLVDWVFT